MEILFHNFKVGSISLSKAQVPNLKSKNNKFGYAKTDYMNSKKKKIIHKVKNQICKSEKKNFKSEKIKRKIKDMHYTILQNTQNIAFLFQ